MVSIYSNLEIHEYFLIKLVIPPNVYGFYEDTALMMGSLSKWVRNFVRKHKGDEKIKQYPFRILDLGCGTGIFSLYLTDRLFKAGFTPFTVGVDINPSAIESARYNARLNNLDLYCHFLTGDFCTPLQGDFAKPYDLILSNPPYTACPPIENQANLSYNEKLFELSWNGGIKGNEATLSLLNQLPPYLSPKGEFMLISSDRIDQTPILAHFSQLQIMIGEIVRSDIRGQDIILYICTHLI